MITADLPFVSQLVLVFCGLGDAVLLIFLVGLMRAMWRDR